MYIEFHRYSVPYDILHTPCTCTLKCVYGHMYMHMIIWHSIAPIESQHFATYCCVSYIFHNSSPGIIFLVHSAQINFCVSHPSLHLLVNETVHAILCFRWLGKKVNVSKRHNHCTKRATSDWAAEGPPNRLPNDFSRLLNDFVVTCAYTFY